MTNRNATQGADLLAGGFGVTVAMWTVCYLARMPVVMAPSGLLGAALLGCLLAGGFVLGRYAQRTWRGGAVVGLISTVLNLLILGSVIKSDAATSNVPSMLVWLPGALLASAVIAAFGALLGKAARRSEGSTPNWTGLFALVAMIATGLVLISGGLVTGLDAGLSVPDWPASYGYNMFLFPLGRMTGSIYYEHAHRLYGALVGSTCVVLAIHLWRSDQRTWLKCMAGLAVLFVVLQGALGGLRVITGEASDGIDIATPEHETGASTALRIVHGVFAQVLLMLMVALAVCTTRLWQNDEDPPGLAPEATDRSLSIVLVVALMCQLLLGAFVRHVHVGILLHISVGVLVAIHLTATCLRAWRQGSPQASIITRLAAALIALVVCQIVLGVMATVVTNMGRSTSAATIGHATITTAHQAVGAALLGAATARMLLIFRLSKRALV
jgi:cytochrome c oxidase assembly protein subunit 15